MFGLGAGEILIVLALALIFIGPKKLPGLAKGLGKGMREFQDAMKGITHDTPDDKYKEYDKKQDDENVITTKANHHRENNSKESDS